MALVTFFRAATFLFVFACGAKFAHAGTDCLSKLNIARLSSEAQGTAKASDPVIRALTMNILKLYACQNAANFFARQDHLPVDEVKNNSVTDNTSNSIQLGTTQNPRLCGELKFTVLSRASVPKFTGPHTKHALTDAYLAFSNRVRLEFMDASADLNTDAVNLIQSFLPNGLDLAPTALQHFEMIGVEIEDKLTVALREVLIANKLSIDEVSSFVEQTKCMPLPEVVMPDAAALQQRPKAYDVYNRFVRHVDALTK